jgi:hypothetical protein
MRILPSRKYKSGMGWCAWRWTNVYPCDDGVLYLVRLHLIKTPWFAVMLHWILSPDRQPDTHNHPTNFLSILLRGAYFELRDARELRFVRWFNFIRAGDFHRIIHLSGERPVLTLCFTGRVVGTWGFKTPQGWVSWREYRGGCSQ